LEYSRDLIRNSIYRAANWRAGSLKLRVYITTGVYSIIFGYLLVKFQINKL
jgi:hypothetical protein